MRHFIKPEGGLGTPQIYGSLARGTVAPEVNCPVGDCPFCPVGSDANSRPVAVVITTISEDNSFSSFSASVR